jgi:hypothetical protein
MAFYFIFIKFKLCYKFYNFILCLWGLLREALLSYYVLKAIRQDPPISFTFSFRVFAQHTRSYKTGTAYSVLVLIRLPLLGFVSFQHISERRARLTRVYLARHVPLSGFLTLSTVFFSSLLPGLFHPGTLLGFSLQSFPFQEIGCSFQSPIPSCRLRYLNTLHGGWWFLSQPGLSETG